MRVSHTPPLHIKLSDLATAGDFAGIAATWDTDRQGERFARTAFSRSLAEWRKRGALPPLLWAHDPNEPIGVLLEAEETDDGLEIVGRLALRTSNGRRAHELLKSGPGSLGLSVGFYATQMLNGAPVPTFSAVDWVELSLVSVPAQAGAVVTSVKTAFPDRKSFEHAAREALGLSASQAKRLAAGGWAAMNRIDHEPDPLQQKEAAAVHEALIRIANAKR